MKSVQSMLKVERLTKTYRTAAGGELTVLREVSFDILAGASAAIVGPSGSGKTTLLGLCAGLDRPSGGTVSIAGESIGEMSEDARALVRNAHVGFVFQNFQLIPTLTALENVLVPVELAGDSTREPEARELLGRVGLGERYEHYPVQLSGGEQQRVAIARAIAKRPAVLMCDEPTGALDVRTGMAVLEAIEQINRDLGTLTLIITHNSVMASMADRVLTLSDGHITGEKRNATRAAASSLAW